MPQATCKRYLEYRFSESELMNMREQLASDTIDLDSKRDQKASIAKQFASDIAEIQTRVSSTASKIRSRSEFREIECSITYDFNTRMKTITRLDTGVIVEEIPMTASELQLELPLEVDDGIETEFRLSPIINGPADEPMSELDDSNRQDIDENPGF